MGRGKRQSGSVRRPRGPIRPTRSSPLMRVFAWRRADPALMRGGGERRRKLGASGSELKIGAGPAEARWRVDRPSVQTRGRETRSRGDRSSRVP